MKVVLAEKPSVARDIARVIGARSSKAGYLEGSGYQVTWAFGHLVELAPPDVYDPNLKQWSLAPLPFIPKRFKLILSSGKGVKKQFNTIKGLFQKADEIICATDAGREGELIFRYIAQLCRVKSKPAKRLWISSLTDKAIRAGFNQLRPLTDFNHLADAAKCRSEADWIVGLNTTRAYTVKHSHGRGVLSVGRVQTPVLAMIVGREQKIRNFKPENYWELWTCYRKAGFKHITDRFTQKEVCQTIHAKITGHSLLITKITEKKSSQMPPKLFDLTELQRFINRKAGFSANQTLAVAQDLYEKKLITYPRTDSRYLTNDMFMQCGQILNRLSAIRSLQIQPIDLNNLRRHKNYVNDAKVADHHAIIPTGQLPQGLSSSHLRVYNEIVTRFIAIFYPPCQKAHTTVAADCLGEGFRAKGTRILVDGWLALYGQEEQKEKQDPEEQVLPVFTLKESGPHSPEVKQCTTKPPKHFTEGSLLSAMETAGKEIEDEALKEAIKDKGLGTPATRAGIIETLVKREYIRKEKRTLLSTPKGEDLIRLLSPQKTLTSPELTGQWEHKLKLMEKGDFSAASFMEQVKQHALNIIDTLTSKKIADNLGLGPCPLCQRPVIIGKTGFGCSAWRSGCPFRFTARQFGTLLKAEDIPALLTTGRLRRPRQLTTPYGTNISGYITLDKNGVVGFLSRREKISAEAVANCPLCGGNVLEKKMGFSCDGCDFIIWKKIAGRTTSKALAKQLIRKGRSRKLKGFRSKAGKPFSAVLRLEKGKVEFEFNDK